MANLLASRRASGSEKDGDRPAAGRDAGAGGRSPAAHRQRTRSRWRDPRLGAGIALVVASVVGASSIVAAADQRVAVLAATRDLAAGTVIGPDDLRESAVLVEEVDRYSTGPASELVGRQLARSVATGELLPRTAVAEHVNGSRLVTLAVEPLHGPGSLARGDRADVYVSARDAAGSDAGAGGSRLVLSRALVFEVAEESRATGEVAVVLQVDPNSVQPLVEASRSGVIDLVRVPVSAL